MSKSPNLFVRIGRVFAPTIRYWMQTEVHVYAFSISAGILLSFFPFLIVMLSLCKYVFHWKAAVSAVYFAMDDYFPDAFGAFLRRNFEFTVASRGPVQVVSTILLFFTASGIFEPLEVALNRVWRCEGNRHYFKNQLVGLALTFACGGLMLLSTTLTALNNQFLVGESTKVLPQAAGVMGLIFFKLAAIPLSMILLFLIYWLLPNCKVKAGRILPVAISVGFLLEVLKYINILTWPYLRAKLTLEYGPFVYSVTILLWGFFAAMVVLAGAEWCARRAGPAPPLDVEA